MATVPLSVLTLQNASLDADDLGVFVNGSTTDTAVTRSGRLLRTLAYYEARFDEALTQAGFMPAVAYASGINITDPRQTVSYDGLVYAPVASAIPFTTSGTFEADKFYLIQGLNESDIADLVKNEDYAFRNKARFADNDPGFKGLQSKQSVIFILGDSEFESVGASEYVKGAGYLTAMSIMNAGKAGYPAGSSFGNPVIINMRNLISSGHISAHTGSLIEEGLVNSRLRCTAGQSVTFTKYAVDYMDIIYAKESSSGSIEIRVNGVLKRTVSLSSGSGFGTTFNATKISNGFLTSESDLITFTAATGSQFTMTAAIPWETATFAPAVFLAALGGTGYQDYISDAKQDEIAYYLNFLGAAVPKVMLTNLGPNNTNNPSKWASPDQTVAWAQELAEGLTSRTTPGSPVKMAFAVPPLTLGTVFPYNTADGWTWEKYRDRFIRFATVDHTYGLIRNDMTMLGTAFPQYFDPDGLHYNDNGHPMAAEANCTLLGILLNGFEKTFNGFNTPPSELSGLGASNTSWTPQLYGTGTAGSFTYEYAYGSLTKIGATTIGTFDFRIASVVSAPSGDLALTGMGYGPSSPGGAGSVGLFSGLTLLTGRTQVTCNMAGNGQPVLYFFQLGSGQEISGIDASNAVAGVRFSGQFIFQS